MLWGLWGTRESELRLLDGFESREDAIELGSGTAAISASLARRGLRPVAVDFAKAQLRTAETFQHEFGPSFPLVLANAEDVPFDSESFDLAISEYGASLWCSPHKWLPEAHRLLRPEGRFIFFTNSALLLTCTPTDGGTVGDRLVRDYFGRYRVEFEPTRERRVPSHARALGPTAPGNRLRDRQPHRGSTSPIREAKLRSRVARVGAAVAERGDLDRTQSQLRTRRG